MPVKNIHGNSDVVSKPGICTDGEPPFARYESLTAWRGIACLSIVIFHSLFNGDLSIVPESRTSVALVEILRRFWIGVPLFFVISGYCVLASADRLRHQNAPVKEFFWRRFRRIYPPYWIWLTLAGLTVYLVETFIQPGFFRWGMITNPAGLTPWQWIGNLTLTETWRSNFTLGVQWMWLSPAWTLAYEEQFYIVVGLMLIATRRFFFQGFALVTLVVVIGTVYPFWGPKAEGTFLDGKWIMFAAGILVYFVVNYSTPHRRFWLCLLLWFGILTALADPRQLLNSRVDEPNQMYLAAFSFALLAIFLHRRDQQLVNCPVLRPFFYCGEMCYSIYLVHWPVALVAGGIFKSLGINGTAAILLIGLPGCIIITVSVARIFHVLIERRFWNLKTGSSQIKDASGSVFNFMPLG
jgi:peptidoglycan/LPS O-acetylase OafA/YrhL